MTTQRGEEPATGFPEDETWFTRSEPRTPPDDAPQPDGVPVPPGTTRAERRRAREAAEAAARPFTDAFIESPSGTTWLRPDLEASAASHGAHAAGPRTNGTPVNGAHARPDGPPPSGAPLDGAHGRADGAQLNGAPRNGAHGRADGTSLNGAPHNGAHGRADSGPPNGAYGRADGALFDGVHGRADGARFDGARLNGAYGRADGTPSDGTRVNATSAVGAHADGARADGARADGARADGARADGGPLDGGPVPGAHSDGDRAGGAWAEGGVGAAAGAAHDGVGDVVAPRRRRGRPPAGGAADAALQAGRVADGDVAGAGFDPGNTGTWRVRDVVPGADGGRRTTTILRYLLGLLAIDHVRALTRWAFVLPFVGLLLLLVHPRWIGLAVIALGVLLIVARIVAVRMIGHRTLPRRYRPVEDDLRAAVEAGKANLRGELRRVGMPSSALALPRSVVRLGSSDSRSTTRSRLRDIEIDRVLPRAQLDRALRVLDGAPTPR